MRQLLGTAERRRGEGGVLSGPSSYREAAALAKALASWQIDNVVNFGAGSRLAVGR